MLVTKNKIVNKLIASVKGQNQFPDLISLFYLLGIGFIRTEDRWYCSATCREAFTYKGDCSVTFIF